MDVALIGTGLMGYPMAARLLESGHSLTVYNRTRQKALPLEELGATIAGNAQEAIAAAEVTVVMLADAASIRETLEPHGRLPDLTGRTLIQMGTIAPRESVALLEDIRRAGGDYLEAPVLGSRPQARDGKLLIMLGATPTQFERWFDLLSCFGPDPRLVGTVGKAAALKLAFNQLIASQLASFSMALGLIRHHDIDVEEFMTLLRQSPLYAPTFDAKLPRLLERDFSDVNFPARLLLKDLTLATDVAADVGLHTAVLEGLKTLVGEALERGLGDADYSVLGELVDPQRS